MYYKCCVDNCGSKRPAVVLHRFPASETGLKKWVKFINSERLRNLNDVDVRKCLFVCHKHFERRFITEKSRIRLGAHPTLFSEAEIETGVLSVTHEADAIGASSRKQLSHPTSTQLVHLGQQVASSEATGKRPKHRKRLIHKVADLPPAFRQIYQQYKKSVKQLDFMKRAKRALAFRKSQSFDKLTPKVNPRAKEIMWMQITQSHKKLKGRRFTDEEKMISLSIMKQSPKAYRFLQKIFILPSRNTLGKMTASLDLQPGVNYQIFDAIKEQVNKWSENKKYCSIIFDEISLEPGLEYDK